MHLNGVPVGTVAVTGWDTSWGFGMFRPDDRFARFAPAFGLWSRLMHAGGDRRAAEPGDVSDALARAENAMDAIKARLYFAADDGLGGRVPAEHRRRTAGVERVLMHNPADTVAFAPA